MNEKEIEKYQENLESEYAWVKQRDKWEKSFKKAPVKRKFKSKFHKLMYQAKLFLVKEIKNLLWRK